MMSPSFIWAVAGVSSKAINNTAATIYVRILFIFGPFLIGFPPIYTRLRTWALLLSDNIETFLKFFTFQLKSLLSLIVY
jgi:hypothetical protein